MIELKARVESIQDTHPDDKIIIFSFFKSFLDLAEGMLVHAMRLSVERFDGDVGGQVRSAALERFRTDPSKKLLLMTIQSGGVGLNITAANHVIFTDRWFNPQVHEQAICRAHRIGQTKPVDVHYLDARNTFDEAVRHIMEKKATNSEFVMRSGKTAIDIGGGNGENLGFQAIKHTISKVSL